MKISSLRWVEAVSEAERKSMILNIPCVTVDSDWSRVKTTLHPTLKIYSTYIHNIDREADEIYDV